jgi:hypothetical protein
MGPLGISFISRGAADPEAAVLLVRGALAADDRARALYGDLAGAAAARHLGISSEHGPGDLVGRAVTASLTGQGPSRPASVSVPFELWVMGQMTASLAQYQPG